MEGVPIKKVSCQSIARNGIFKCCSYILVVWGHFLFFIFHLGKQRGTRESLSGE